MNNFEIYIKTSALGKTGIHWRKIDKEKQPEETPLLVKRTIIEAENPKDIRMVNDLLRGDQKSLLILRDSLEKKLLLEITGFESPSRSERLGRKVFSTLVLIAKDCPENENIIRSITCQEIEYLFEDELKNQTSPLEELLDKAIDFDGQKEFRCNWTSINNFINNKEKLENTPIAQKQKIEIKRKTPDNLNQLVEQISKYSLPKQWESWDNTIKTDGVLLVITDRLEDKTLLHRSGVWRGFAINSEEPIKQNKKLEITEENNSTKKKLQGSKQEVQISPKEQHDREIIPLGILILITVLVLSLIILLALIQHQEKPEKIPQNTNNKLIQEIDPVPNLCWLQKHPEQPPIIQTHQEIQE